MSHLKRIAKHKMFIVYALLGLSVLALTVAYVAEYFFHLKPCVLCLYQRIPYGVCLALCSLMILFKRSPKILKYGIFMCLCTFVLNLGIAGFHVGVEEKWWEGSEGCVGASGALTIDQLRAQIMNAPIVRCDEASFKFLGISMTGWNGIYVIGSLFALAFLMKIRKSNNHERTH